MIVKCENGHWYDTAVNRSCPHCKRNSEKLGIRLDDIEEDDRTISIAEVDLSLGDELGAIIGGSIQNQMNTGIFDNEDMDFSEDSDKTISFGFFDIVNLPPVVGWLICMTGAERGKDFRLHAEKNFVGRSTSMDVVLVDDKKIARDKHCSIQYDPKGNTFYAAPENGNLTYMNDKVIDSPMIIQEGDLLTIGETKLMFVPFCREERVWEIE
ncbi:MAG: FHA domain-containing protein [Lachnospiraceae bacterium]|nr:FHA domain-containing protein [Lachnospiraceae bacterium]